MQGADTYLTLAELLRSATTPDLLEGLLRATAPLPVMGAVVGIGGEVQQGAGPRQQGEGGRSRGKQG